MGKSVTLTGVVQNKETRLFLTFSEAQDGTFTLQMNGQFHIEASDGSSVAPVKLSGAAASDLVTAFNAAVQAAITAGGY